MQRRLYVRQEGVVMKKYSDWQKYVREQIDGMGNSPGAPEPKAQGAPLPGLDKNKFVIHKKEAGRPAPAAEPPRPAASFPPHPAAKAAAASGKLHAELPRQAAPAAPQPAVQAHETQAEPAEPMASPFVSVHDVWEAAEKAPRSTHVPRVEPSRPAAQPATAASKPKPLPQHQPLPHTQPEPVISRVRQTQPVQQKEDQRPSREQTREEIIERLVNPTITLEEAAKIMGVCKATVRRYTAMGILPHYRTPGNQRRFKLNDIILFLENQKK